MNPLPTVTYQLEVAGLTPSDEEVSELEIEYVLVQQMVSLLYGAEETRYDSPALRFEPNPVFADWSDPSAD